jgi:SAM-dependent methyltransferase
MRYTFGHTDTAAERLRRIANFFNPLAFNFIRENLGDRLYRVADLGCGPGYTTNMLATATASREVFGIDISGYFISLCKKIYPKYNFLQADLTRWKTDLSFDLLHCRFLLSHLSNIPALLQNWMSYLCSGGVLVIDELEDILTEVPVFKRYLEISDALIHSQGADLYIGKRLNHYLKDFKILTNYTETIAVEDSMAAGWFYPNTISIWMKEKYILNTVTETERSALSEDLMILKNQEGKNSRITWKMKKIILTRKSKHK